MRRVRLVDPLRQDQICWPHVRRQQLADLILEAREKRTTDHETMDGLFTRKGGEALLEGMPWSLEWLIALVRRTAVDGIASTFLWRFMLNCETAGTHLMWDDCASLRCQVPWRREGAAGKPQGNVPIANMVRTDLVIHVCRSCGSLVGWWNFNLSGGSKL